MPSLNCVDPVDGKAFGEIAGPLLSMDAASWPGSTGDEDKGERRKGCCEWNAYVSAKEPGFGRCASTAPARAGTRSVARRGEAVRLSQEKTARAARFHAEKTGTPVVHRQARTRLPGRHRRGRPRARPRHHQGRPGAELYAARVFLACDAHRASMQNAREPALTGVRCSCPRLGGRPMRPPGGHFRAEEASPENMDVHSGAAVRR